MRVLFFQHVFSFPLLISVLSLVTNLILEVMIGIRLETANVASKGQIMPDISVGLL